MAEIWTTSRHSNTASFYQMIPFSVHRKTLQTHIPMVEMLPGGPHKLDHSKLSNSLTAPENECVYAKNFKIHL